MIKKRFFLTMVSMLAAGATLLAAGCGNGESFRLAHSDGMNTEAGYDTDLLYKNNSELWGGDSGVIWVPEERDPEYGGYFYQYMSEVALLTNTTPSSDGSETPAWPDFENGTAAYTSYVVVTRSKDLNDWEICRDSLDGGMALRVENDEWLYGKVWAPECLYDEESGKYFLYFSAWSKRNNDDLRAQGARYSDALEDSERTYLSVAVSDSPVGPFYLASSVKSDPVYGNYDPDENEFLLDEEGNRKPAVNPAYMIDEEGDKLFYTDEYRARDDFADKDEVFVAIDAHPFRGENGMYFYFSRSRTGKEAEKIGKEEGVTEYNVLWGMRLLDMVTPDYSTLSFVVANTWEAEANFRESEAKGNIGKTFVRVEYKGKDYVDPDNPEFPNDPEYPRHLSTSWVRYTTYADGSEQSDTEMTDGRTAEAPQMLTTKDKDGKTVYLLTYSPISVSNPNYNVKFAYSYNPLSGFVKPTAEQGAVILGLDEKNTFMTNLGHVQFLEVDGQWWIVHWEYPDPFGVMDIGRIYALSSMTWQYEERLGFNVPVANGPTKSLQPLPSVASGYRNVADCASATATNVLGDSEKYLNDGLVVTAGRNADKEFRADGESTITLTFDEPVYIRGILVYQSYNYLNAFKNISRITFTLAEVPAWYGGNADSCVIENLPYNVEEYTTGPNALQAGSAAVATFNEILVTKIEIEIGSGDMIGSGGELRVSEIVVLGR